jgi:hypothetical protein
LTARKAAIFPADHPMVDFAHFAQNVASMLLPSGGLMW